MPTIRVHQRVLDALAVNGTFGDTYNDLLCDLLNLPRTPLTAPRGPGKLSALVAAELLHGGQTVVWRRPRIGETFTAVITSDGHMRTPDGRTFRTPDICASELSGYPCKGWTVWQIEDGTTLQSLLERLPARRTGPSDRDAQGPEPAAGAANS